MIRVWHGTLAAGFMLALSGCSDGGGSSPAESRAGSVTASEVVVAGEQGGRRLTASLTGAAEAPGPGDPDGSGVTTVTLNQGQGQVCFEITVENIAPATAAHIHVAPAGSPGPVVVPLAPPGLSGTSSGCVEGVNQDLIKAIRQNPSGYYVNVHNAEYPPGAVRGQLSK